MKSSLPIGIFDSGIGGLTVYKQVKRLLPREDVIYFGDTARAPYGPRTPQQIRGFVKEILSFMDVCHVKIAVSACNTITVLGLDGLQGQYPFKILGMSKGTQLAVSASSNKRIGVIGTEVTISSGQHRQEMLALDSEVKVYAKACPKFAALIEKGNLSGSEIETAIIEYLTPLKNEKIDTLVLACTHYPYIETLIKQFMGNQVTIIDPAKETADQVVAAISSAGGLNSDGIGEGKLYFSQQAQQARNIAESIMDTSKCVFTDKHLDHFLA